MSSQQLEKFRYDDTIVRNFAIATVVWGLVAFLAGLLAALQLASHHFNVDHIW